ncbi:hypothetical protein BDZ85DRAFT_269119 [Elsinoe ampelina]|uniref:EF-hand domain-containing protein n=1 Tax=Elsinoe ampelina TaxID=302913 RepID=A0A6A6G0R0_9PEZI|nr:hypothetical protein BDZ85DRAFT_269119 [Elsinoe ampelina]
MASLRASLLLCLVPLVVAHSPLDHHQEPLAEGGDWITRHMASEHHISVFDSGSIFNLHDYSSRGWWDTDDIERTYGLLDHTAADVPTSKKEEVVSSILRLYDSNHDGFVSREEFTQAFDRGVRLPDFGLGPGHHGDDEYEYEIHHFEKYHDENTKEEDLIHDEDKAHFAMHERLDELQEQLDKSERESHGVQEGNIPSMFKRAG